MENTQPYPGDDEELGDELAALRSDELEALVRALINAEYETELPSRQAGADGGFDFKVDGPHGRELFIVKRHVPPFPELRAIMERAGRTWSTNRVVVATPEEVSDTTRRRLSMTVGNYVDTWDRPVLLELLSRHPGVRARFFVPPATPPADPLQRLVLWLADREDIGPGTLPGWLRLVLLCGVVGGIVVSPLHVTPSEAQLIGLISLVVILLAVLSTGVSWKDIGDRLAAAARPRTSGTTVGVAGFGVELSLRFQRVSVPPTRMVALVLSLLVLRGLRLVGSTLTGLGFFAAWTAAYMLLWGTDPATCAVSGATSCTGAFAGIGSAPTIGDFAYFGTNVAFFSPPQSIQAVSRAASALQTAEMVMAAGLLATFAAQIGMAVQRRRRTEDVDPE